MVNVDLFEILAFGEVVADDAERRMIVGWNMGSTFTLYIQVCDRCGDGWREIDTFCTYEPCDTFEEAQDFASHWLKERYRAQGT